jgi:hypothetical protein
LAANFLNSWSLALKNQTPDVRKRIIDIVRISGGKIVERWGGSDDLGLLQQLGAL